MNVRRLGFRAAFFGLAVLAGVALSLKPWQAYNQQRKIADQSASEMRSAEAHRAELLRKEAKAGSPIGREELAREQGYVKPGEHDANGG
jgi:hypothetical protein